MAFLLRRVGRACPRDPIRRLRRLFQSTNNFTSPQGGIIIQLSHITHSNWIILDSQESLRRSCLFVCLFFGFWVFLFLFLLLNSCMEKYPFTLSEMRTTYLLLISWLSLLSMELKIMDFLASDFPIHCSLLFYIVMKKVNLKCIQASRPREPPTKNHA